jgi:DNA-binding helix-hairpin-helix protein with protein kinase domain
VKKVPGFGDARTRMLLDWRQQKEAGFKFDPNRSDHIARLQAAQRRLSAERRQQERLLTRVRAQLDALVDPIRQRKVAVERAAQIATREFAQALLDAQTL